MLSRGDIHLVYSEILFDYYYEGQGWFHEIWGFLVKYGYRLYDLYSFMNGPHGQLLWGDAIFVRA